MAQSHARNKQVPRDEDGVEKQFSLFFHHNQCRMLQLAADAEAIRLGYNDGAVTSDPVTGKKRPEPEHHRSCTLLPGANPPPPLPFCYPHLFCPFSALPATESFSHSVPHAASFRAHAEQHACLPPSHSQCESFLITAINSMCRPFVRSAVSRCAEQFTSTAAAMAQKPLQTVEHVLIDTLLLRQVVPALAACGQNSSSRNASAEVHGSQTSSPPTHDGRHAVKPVVWTWLQLTSLPLLLLG